MTVPVVLFAAVSCALFCVLFYLIVRLSFDQVGNRFARMTITLAILAAGGAFWLASLYQERVLVHTIHRKSCRSNLEEIHRAWARETAESHDTPPERLRNLLRRSDLKSSQLVCPSTGEDYPYTPAASARLDFSILARDPSPHRLEFLWMVEERRHVLFADGRIEWVSQDEFQRLASR